MLRAEEQLAANSTIPAFYTTNTTAQVINFTKKTPPDWDGYFDNDAQVPGLQPDVNGTEDFAMEVQTYLNLAAGQYRFGVRCDDGYKITAGSTRQT